nr:hypothetical protein [uncultured Campylobacter sp.]
MKKFFIAIVCLVSSVFAYVDTTKCETELKIIVNLVSAADGGVLTQTLHDDFWTCMDAFIGDKAPADTPKETLALLNIPDEKLAFMNKFPNFNKYYWLSVLETYRAKKKIIKKEFKDLVQSIKDYKGSKPELYNSNKDYRDFINGFKNGILSQSSLDILDKVAKREPVFLPVYNQTISLNEENIKLILQNLEEIDIRIKGLFNKNYTMDISNEELVGADNIIKTLTQAYSYQEVAQKFLNGEDLEKMLYAAKEIIKNKEINNTTQTQEIDLLEANKLYEVTENKKSTKPVLKETKQLVIVILAFILLISITIILHIIKYKIPSARKICNICLYITYAMFAVIFLVLENYITHFNYFLACKIGFYLSLTLIVFEKFLYYYKDKGIKRSIGLLFVWFIALLIAALSVFGGEVNDLVFSFEKFATKGNYYIGEVIGANLITIIFFAFCIFRTYKSDKEYRYSKYVLLALVSLLLIATLGFLISLLIS